MIDVNLKELLPYSNNLSEEELLEMDRCLRELGRLPQAHSLFKLMILACQIPYYGNKQASAEYEVGRRDMIVYLKNLLNNYRG